jgi:hypothetical protein
MAFELLGKNPVRFRYTDGVMEASWTVSPDDPELVMKLQRMLQFVTEHDDGGYNYEVVPVPVVSYAPKTLEPPPIPNGWELLDQSTASDEA